METIIVETATSGGGGGVGGEEWLFKRCSLACTLMKNDIINRML